MVPAPRPLDGYCWYGHNRKTLHVNAKAGSGRVGLLVQNDVLNHFTISVLDDEYEGILRLKLVNIDKVNDCFCICVRYLPPENSTRAIQVT